MKKNLLLSLTFILGIILQSSAAFVNQEQATAIARVFMNNRMATAQKAVNFSFDAHQVQAVQSEGREAYYVFNFDEGGFVIISAEDAYVPVIAYSTDGSFKTEDQTPEFRSFMANYEDQIQYLRNHQMQADAGIRSQWTSLGNGDIPAGDRSVSPLCYSKWNQNYPYNGLCPDDSQGPGGHVYSGCVATAMSQIMYYWRWPLQGTGQHSYNYGQYGTISADFGASTYGWENMGNQTQIFNEEMAEIQFHCGVAVDMMYGAGGSGAYSEDVPAAIISHFGYNPAAEALHRNDFTDSEWEAMLMEQIDAGSPLYHSGCSNSGCHAFVCDGYDDNSPRLFHFNFGWSGQSDGYYTINNVGGFSSWQAIVRNFRPVDTYAYNTAAYTEINHLAGTVEDGSGPVKPYTSNSEYKWYLNPQTGADSISGIKLHFNRFALGTGDVLKIYNGANENGALIGEYTGANLPADIVSTGNKLFIHFITDATDNGNGWLFEFVATRPIWCNGLTLFEATEGSFDDGSVNFNYRENSTCMYQIKPADVSEVTVYFDNFDTEPVNDFVRVYDGTTQELLATYSGAYPGASPAAPVTSTNGHLLLVFKTNNTMNAGGWSVHYDSKPVGINSPEVASGISISPNPVKSMARVNIPATISGEFTMSICDVAGATLYTKNTIATNHSGNSFDVDMQGFANGLYLVTFRWEGGTTLRKIIVNQ